MRERGGTSILFCADEYVLFVCKNISNYTKSLEYFTKSLKIAREMENMGNRVVHTLNNIGEIYIESLEIGLLKPRKFYPEFRP